MWKGQAVSVSVPDINIILRSLIKNIFIKILMEPSGFVFVLSFSVFISQFVLSDLKALKHTA